MNTLGEKRVRTEFNPSKDTLVDQIKQKSAELINLCESMKRNASQMATDDDIKSSEINRCVALAQTHYEDAAMWAVKAATF